MNELQRALRYVDLNEIADVVERCYQEEAELSDLPTKHPKSPTPDSAAAEEDDSPEEQQTD